MLSACIDSLLSNHHHHLSSGTSSRVTKDNGNMAAYGTFAGCCFETLKSHRGRSRWLHSDHQRNFILPDDSSVHFPSTYLPQGALTKHLGIVVRNNCAWKPGSAFRALTTYSSILGYHHRALAMYYVCTRPQLLGIELDERSVRLPFCFFDPAFRLSRSNPICDIDPTY
jgi:hypothetical protein